MSEERLKPFIAPVFIPHKGCPHRCVFCDQERITSQPKRLSHKSYTKEVLNNAIRSKDFDPRRKPTVAFYGGTFTRLPLGEMKELLEIVAPYIAQGLFRSIRVSTRPDALDEERLKIMKNYGVLTVELGAQSMDNRVLSLSQRGHTAEATVSAVQLLRKSGFAVGIQLMPGLPGDSRASFNSTISKIISLHPDMVRLYPALVIRGTKLACWYSEGRYQPLDLEEAVEICMEACIRLEAEGIPVIRIGLMSSASLLEKGQIVAGPWHPAFGFLVRSAIHQRKIEHDLPGTGEVSHLKIFVPRKEIPLLRGYKNQGIKRIEHKTGAKTVTLIPDDSIAPGSLRIENL